jgi:hypothetical protein
VTKRTGTLAQPQLAPSYDNAPAHTFLKTTESVTNNNMVIISHPPYLLDLAPCDFAFLLKLKMKLKGQHFETVSDIQRYSKWYSTALRKMTSTVLAKHGKNNRITVYILKEPILKATAARIKLSQHFFFDLVQELSNSISYVTDQWCAHQHTLQN